MGVESHILANEGNAISERRVLDLLHVRLDYKLPHADALQLGMNGEGVNAGRPPILHVTGPGPVLSILIVVVRGRGRLTRVVHGLFCDEIVLRQRRYDVGQEDAHGAVAATGPITETKRVSSRKYFAGTSKKGKASGKAYSTGCAVCSVSISQPLVLEGTTVQKRPRQSSGHVVSR